MGFHPDHFAKKYRQTSGYMHHSFLGGEISAYNHKHLKFERGGEGESIHFPGETFLFNVSSISYYHGLIDVLGNYLLIKKNFPNTNLVLASTSETPNTDGFGKPKLYPFMKHVLKLMGVSSNTIYALENYKEISFDELRYIVNHEDYFLKYAFDAEIITEDQSFNSASYQNQCSKAVKDMLRQHVQVMPNAPSNIFIDFNVEKIQFLSVPEKKERFFDSRHYYDWRNFLVDSGYAAIDPAKLSMQEQMNYVFNADKIVTITGSNSCHSLYCNDNAKFVLTNFNTHYRFPHDQLVKNNIKDAHIIFDRSNNPDRLFTFEDWKKEFLRVT